MQNQDEAHLTVAWGNLILYCQRYVPHGEITVRIVNGEPKDLISSKRKIRFDQPNTLPPWPEPEAAILEQR